MSITLFCLKIKQKGQPSVFHQNFNFFRQQFKSTLEKYTVIEFYCLKTEVYKILLIFFIFMKLKKLVSVQEAFEIRSQNSFSNVQGSRCESIESLENPSNQISNVIDNFISQQKKLYLPSRTQNKIVRHDLTKTKRFFSVSNVSAFKPLIQLPQHIGRILNSTKRYPNVPNLQRNEDQLDSIYGAFFGFIIGDVIGSYLAYTARSSEIFIPSALLMNGGGTYNLGPGQGTDQTQILLSLCYGLIQSQGNYNQNKVATKYIQWFESKPFNFSAVFALSMKDVRKMKQEKKKIDSQKISEIIKNSSLINSNQQSSIGLIRILPLTLFSLKFSDAQFQKLIRDQLSMICPNQLVIESGFVYGKILRVIFLTHDQQRAFYEASKWVYQHGSSKLRQLWKIIQKGLEIPSRGNMGKLKTCFTYSCIQINKREVNFIDSLIRILMKGGDTQTNCAVVLTLVGAIVGYNGIPGYFKQKIVNSRMKDSPRVREEKYSPYKIIEIIQKLQKVQTEKYNKIS